MAAACRRGWRLAAVGARSSYWQRLPLDLASRSACASDVLEREKRPLAYRDSAAPLHSLLPASSSPLHYIQAPAYTPVYGRDLGLGHGHDHPSHTHGLFAKIHIGGTESQAASFQFLPSAEQHVDSRLPGNKAVISSVDWKQGIWLPRPLSGRKMFPHCLHSSQAYSTGFEKDAVSTTIVPRGVEDKDSKAASEISWISNLPPSFQPFAHLARLSKPAGTWLLAWPCFWSIALAAPPGHLPDAKMLALFGAGALLLRGAGCTVNDLLDRKIDAQVARTRQRPLAAGTVTPFQAVAFLGAQLLLGLMILLQLNTFSQVLGASSLLLVFTYPLMKRVTYWPQAYLGLTFNWGALLGWAAVRGSLDLPIVLPLYAAAISWTLVYDTIYAHQDKDDDRKVGVKSTALLFDKHTPYWLAGFSTTMISGLALAGHAAELGWPFDVALMAVGAHLAWQVAGVNYNSKSDCATKFASNKWLGAIVFAGVLLGKLAVPT